VSEWLGGQHWTPYANHVNGKKGTHGKQAIDLDTLRGLEVENKTPRKNCSERGKLFPKTATRKEELDKDFSKGVSRRLVARIANGNRRERGTKEEGDSWGKELKLILAQRRLKKK